MSRRLEEDETIAFSAQHFSMGDRAPLLRNEKSGEYWITDEKASEIYRKLNEEAVKVCAVQGIRVNDLYGLCAEENLQKSDGVHFQEDAYQRLAVKVAEALKQSNCFAGLEPKTLH